jgi:hypothetical protein
MKMHSNIYIYIFVKNNGIYNASCIWRYSNFLLSETESLDGKAVIQTVTTTSSGKEESVASTASSGFTFPMMQNALQREWDDYAFPQGKSVRQSYFNRENIKIPRKNQEVRCKETNNLQPPNIRFVLTIESQDDIFYSASRNVFQLYYVNVNLQPSFLRHYFCYLLNTIAFENLGICWVISDKID